MDTASQASDVEPCGEGKGPFLSPELHAASVRKQAREQSDGPVRS